MSNINRVIDNLETISLADFEPPNEFLSLVQSRLNESNKLGEGAFGIVYAFEDNLAIKIYNACRPTPIPVQRYYCEQVNKDGQILKLPHDDKVLIILPNVIYEGVIGGFMNYLYPFSPHITRTRAIYYSQRWKTSYTVIDRVYTDLHTHIRGATDAYTLLFQVAHTLYVSQALFRFTHYDIHGGNLGYISTPHSFIQYHVPGRTVYIKNSNFLVKLIDYGLSRLETDKYVINSQLDTIPINSYGLYNPYYDFITFYTSLLILDIPLSTAFKNALPEKERDEIRSYITGNNLLKYSYWRLADANFRPSSDQTYPNITEIMLFLLDKLSGLNVVSDIIPFGDVLTTQAPPNIQIRALKRSMYKHYNAYTIDRGIYTKSFWDTFREKNFNHTGDFDEFEFTRSGSITSVFINTRLATESGYTLSTICCKIDPANYLENHYGVAINATFFDINKYTPIGPYIDHKSGFTSDTQIPPTYAGDYGAVYIENNHVFITRIDNLNTDYSNLFASGPLLVYNGIALFNDAKMYDTEPSSSGPVYKYQCSVYLEYTSDDVVSVFDDKLAHNCYKISPGELSHGGNPNPRSMILARDAAADNEWDLAFVTIEGRKNYSEGADFLDMIRVALGLGARHAIALDGGRSSNLAYRSPYDPNIVYVSNHLESYPVGNILTLSKPL